MAEECIRLLACFLGSILFIAQSSLLAQTVSLRDVANTLARGRVPAGLVVEGPVFTPTLPPGQSVPIAIANRRADVADVDRVTPQHRVSRAEDVIHLREHSEPVEVSMASEQHVNVSKGLHMTAFDAIFRKAVGALSGVEPQAFAGIGAVPDSDCRLDMTLQPSQDSPTVLELLDDVTRQASGVVWVVMYDAERPQALKVGVVCPDGTFLRVATNQ